MYFDLMLYVFMAFSLIAGVSMAIFTIGHRKQMRKYEVIGRVILGIFMVYSITVRVSVILVPSGLHYMKLSSIGTDLFLISLCVFANINLLNRGRSNGSREDDKGNKRNAI